jgi:hemoglobin-like flavoprotein
MLSVYGRRHHGYGVSDAMLDLMSDCFIVAIQPPLEDNWNKEVDEAWRALFRCCF